MKTITRYSPVLGKTITDRDYAYMREDESGFYVAMHDHASEMESARARIRELELNKKYSISISSIIAEYVEDALRKSIGEAVHEVLGDMLKAGLNKYNGDPCHNTVDSILDELPVGPGKTVKAESSRNRNVAVCYYVGGNEFINGCEYEYEVDDCETDSKPRFIHIVQDAFVSDLKGDDRWRALKVGNVVNATNGKLCDAYAIVNPDSGVVAQFYIK